MKPNTEQTYKCVACGHILKTADLSSIRCPKCDYKGLELFEPDMTTSNTEQKKLDYELELDKILSDLQIQVWSELEKWEMPARPSTPVAASNLHNRHEAIKKIKALNAVAKMKEELGL